MSTVTSIKKELLDVTKKLPKDRIQEAIDFINFLRLKEAKNNFSDRVDILWGKMRKSAERSGYGLKDVERIISKVRARKD